MLSFALYKFDITDSVISVLFEVKKLEIPDLENKPVQKIENSLLASLIHAFFCTI